VQKFFTIASTVDHSIRKKKHATTTKSETHRRQQPYATHGEEKAHQRPVGVLPHASSRDQTQDLLLYLSRI
jgi:hypothetical protein